MNIIDRVLNALLAQVVRISGSSMEPTLPDGSWVLVNRRAFRWPYRPARFDIVRLEDPAQPGHWIIKRIVGLPDEEVRLDGGLLFVNGRQVPENHLAGPAQDAGHHEWWPCTNEYVVLGDNRGASTDSRKFGTVPIGALRGRIGRRLR